MLISDRVRRSFWYIFPISAQPGHLRSSQDPARPNFQPHPINPPSRVPNAMQDKAASDSNNCLTRTTGDFLAWRSPLLAQLAVPKFLETRVKQGQRMVLGGVTSKRRLSISNPTISRAPSQIPTLGTQGIPNGRVSQSGPEAPHRSGPPSSSVEISIFYTVCSSLGIFCTA